MHRKSAAGGRSKFDLSALAAGDTGGHLPETAAGEHQKLDLSALVGDTGDHSSKTAAGKHRKFDLSKLAGGDHVQWRGEGAQSRELYEAVLNNDLKKIKTQLFSIQENPIDDPQQQQRLLLQGLNVAGDTALHIAAHQSYDLLRELLDLSQLSPLSSYEGGGITMQNVFGNTPLHEAAAAGCLDAVELLCETCRYLIDVKNYRDETAMFRAAAFGKTHVVKFLVRKIKQKDLEYHCIRDCDSISIFHVAMLGHHIETALWIQMNVDLLPESEPLHLRMDERHRTCLHLLASTPSVFPSGCKSKGWIYYCLPVDEDNIENVDYDDFRYMSFCGLEAGGQYVCGPYQFCSRYISKEWPQIETIWSEKRRHTAAINLTKELVQDDLSWELSSKEDVNLAAINQSWEKGKAPAVLHSPTHEETEVKIEGDESQTPLLIAASNGILEIVKAILEVFPQAIEHTDTKTKENILHVTIQHRQREIFSLVKKKKFPLRRLAMRLDENDNTIMHQVANMEFYRLGTKPNPALQLQEELQWFKRVKRLMPIHYVMHHNKDSKTAKDLFDEKHKEQLEKAQNWTKDTSTSCSTIAALVATVVFAAAYTIPGGTTENGIPNFLHYPLFLVFTVMDIVSLTSSLTSLILFLSILTSPYHMQDFYMSIPRKLMLGFTFLFLSVATAMVAFTVSILLIIQLQKRWTTTLIYTIALLPVSMFTLVLLPLFAGFKDTLRFTRKRFMQFLPRCINTIIKGRKMKKGKLA
ncbi:hypothetical protein Ancab_019816 [Ancistrocladus abbreviatus]